MVWAFHGVKSRKIWVHFLLSFLFTNYLTITLGLCFYKRCFVLKIVFHSVISIGSKLFFLTKTGIYFSPWLKSGAIFVISYMLKYCKSAFKFIGSLMGEWVLTFYALSFDVNVLYVTSLVEEKVYIAWKSWGKWLRIFAIYPNFLLYSFA